MMVANRVNEINVSETMHMATEAKKLKAEGVDVINLSMGEPDFPTPHNIKEAGKIGIEENHTRYTINSGTLKLRTAIQAKLKRDNHLDYKLSEIIVSSGAKQSCYNAILTTVNPGDEVIVPSPYLVSYPAMVNLAQGRLVVIESEEKNGFRITAEELEKAVTPKTKMSSFVIHQIQQVQLTTKKNLKHRPKSQGKVIFIFSLMKFMRRWFMTILNFTVLLR